jgi:hypothetical protein
MLTWAASAIDILHAAAMMLWVLGFPLLIWHGRPRLSRVYAWYSLLFVLISQGSHWLLGECVLTTLARYFWEAAELSGTQPRVLFTVRLVNFVAGVRPSERTAVLVWEWAVVAAALGLLWYWRATRQKRRTPLRSQGFEKQQAGA